MKFKHTDTIDEQPGSPQGAGIPPMDDVDYHAEWLTSQGFAEPESVYEGRLPEKVKGANPKDAMGKAKLPIFTVVPVTGLIAEAEAFAYGAYEAPNANGNKGYGPYNWRETEVAASIYIDALVRHLIAWIDGEDHAVDSKAHHLGHLRACANIILDAAANGTLIDDRPPKGSGAALLALINKQRKERAQK